MSPRVTYWTGTWDPAKEAISKEIESLRRGDRARAAVISYAPRQTTRWLRRDRVVRLTAPAWPLLRGMAMLIEPRGDVTHIFGGQSSWHLVRALGRRPILLTAVLPRGPHEALPHVRFARVVVEADDAVDEWLAAGVPRDRIEVVLPGIDVTHFDPAPPPRHEAGRFRLLFASTPSNPVEIEPRGIGLLVALARQRDDVEIVVPWRVWGPVDQARRALDALRPPANFVVTYEDAADMRRLYASVHATVACFAPGVGKTLPSFVLEGFAVGRPCLCTTTMSLAPIVAGEGAGVAVAREIAALMSGVDQLRASWPSYSERARALAVAKFDEQRFVAAYERLYSEIAAHGAV
jgi:glycosyltransferase involved in cell wall biosynthesis